MKIVIQCASRKHPAAASLSASDGRAVLFVAHPELAPGDASRVYARPDDIAAGRQTWRSRIIDYNRDASSNLLNLLPAYQLYANDTYRRLVNKFGLKSVFILSAGWGLIPAAFLTPNYDITFSVSADLWKRRGKRDAFEDLRMIPDDGADILFLGGKDYLPLFCRLTAAFGGTKIVFFNSAQQPSLPAGFRPVNFRTTTRTNWHYECASAVIAGEVAV